MMCGFPFIVVTEKSVKPINCCKSKTLHCESMEFMKINKYNSTKINILDFIHLLQQEFG